MMIALLTALLAVVNSSNNAVSYACDGVTAVYTVNYPYLAYTDLVVTSTTAGGAVTALTYTTDYTVNLASTYSTATLTLNAPATKCPVNNTLKITRTLALTQPTSFKAQTTFNPGTHETAYDRLVMEIQQLNSIISGTQAASLSTPNTYTATQTFMPPGDAVVAVGGSAGRGVVASSGSTSGVAAQFTTGNTVNAPIQVVGQTADPSTPVNGEVWLNTTQQAGKIRVNGASNIFSGNPFLSATTTAGQSITNGSIVIVVFGTVDVDSDSAYNSGTGRFTVPAGKGGVYTITSTIQFVNAQAGATFIIIYKNGAQIRGHWVNNPGANEALTISAILSLSAGDIVDIRAQHPSGSAQSLSVSSVYNFFAIKGIPN